MTVSKTAETQYYNGIAPALVAFQRSIPKVAKDATAKAGAYSYDYATLDRLVEVIFPKLTEVGLAYTAVPDLTELGFGLRAKLLHESGEEISGFYPLGNPNNPAQAIGSAISYARRYALLSLTGVAPAGEDDDGASASAAQASAPQQEEAKQPTSSAAALRAEMGELITNSGGLVDGDDANAVMDKITGGKTPGGWTAADLKKGKAEIVKLIAQRKAAK
jgi:ERF superfamily.